MSYHIDAGSYTPSSTEISPNHTHTSTIGHKRVHSDIDSTNNTENLNTLNLQSTTTIIDNTVPPPYHYHSQQCSPNMKIAAGILSGSHVHRPAPTHNNTATQAQITPRRDHSAPSQLAVYNSVMSPMSMLMAGSDYLATDKKDGKQQNESVNTIKQHETDTIHHNTHTSTHTTQSPVLHTSTLQPFNYLGNIRSSSAPTYDTLNDNDNVLPQQPYSSNPLQSTIPATVLQRTVYNDNTQHNNTIQPSTPPLHAGIMSQLNNDTPSVPQQHMSHLYSTSPLLSYNSGQSYVTQTTPTQSHSSNVSSTTTQSIDDTPYILMSDPKNKFGCVDCAKQFPSKSSLHMHTLTHTGDKPFHCTYPDCSKSFRQKGHLVSHYRRHTGEKPFECTVCQNQFKDKSGLNTHIRKHHSTDSNALAQLDSDTPIVHRNNKMKQSRKFSTDTTSSDSRSNSTSPNRQPKGRKNTPGQHTIHNKSQYGTPVGYQSITVPVRSDTPPMFNGYRVASYTYNIPIDDINTMSQHDTMTNSYMHQHQATDVISPQSASMMLTSPVFHTQHETSEPFI